MRNLSIQQPRCRGTDGAYNPNVCEVRNQCHRFRQLELDRQLELPPEVKIQVLNFPRVGMNECHYAMQVRD